MPGLAPYRSGDEAAVLAYLGRRPYDHVYVAWLLKTRQIGRHDDVVVWRDDHDSIAGAALVASRIVLCADSPASLRAIAAHAGARVREPRTIVGPKDAVDVFWTAARNDMPEPYAVRSRQPVFALTRSELRGGSQDFEVARATQADVDLLAIESARMTSGELGYAIAADGAYRKRTARIVTAGWYWRSYVDGKLAFMCHVGSETEHTAQIQGVWTPPAMRGRGHAVRAFATICSRLLAQYPTLSLYVNDYNAPAIALYERVGFARVGTFSTIIFA